MSNEQIKELENEQKANEVNSTENKEKVNEAVSIGYEHLMFESSKTES